MGGDHVTAGREGYAGDSRRRGPKARGVACETTYPRRATIARRAEFVAGERTAPARGAECAARFRRLPGHPPRRRLGTLANIFPGIRYGKSALALRRASQSSRIFAADVTQCPAPTTSPAWRPARCLVFRGRVRAPCQLILSKLENVQLCLAGVDRVLNFGLDHPLDCRA